MEAKKVQKKPESKKQSRPRYDLAVKEEVISLARQGLTLKEILEKVKPRKRAVLRYLKKADINIGA